MITRIQKQNNLRKMLIGVLKSLIKEFKVQIFDWKIKKTILLNDFSFLRSLMIYIFFFTFSSLINMLKTLVRKIHNLISII